MLLDRHAALAGADRGIIMSAAAQHMFAAVCIAVLQGADGMLRQHKHTFT